MKPFLTIDGAGAVTGLSYDDPQLFTGWEAYPVLLAGGALKMAIYLPLKGPGAPGAYAQLTPAHAKAQVYVHEATLLDICAGLAPTLPDKLQVVGAWPHHEVMAYTAQRATKEEVSLQWMLRRRVFRPMATTTPLRWRMAPKDYAHLQFQTAPGEPWWPSTYTVGAGMRLAALGLWAETREETPIG